MTITTKEAKILEFLDNYSKNVEFEHKQRLVAALTTRKGEVIGLGRNSMKSHPFQARFAKNNEAIYLHAETSALLDAINNGVNPSGATMHVIRKLRDGTLGLARPCQGCMRALAAYGVDRVVYSNEVGSYSVEYRVK
jgi:deoxycytidylate deaminase